MRILYAAQYHDYGYADRGPSFEEANLGGALRHMSGVEVVDFHFDKIQHRGGNVDAELLAAIQLEAPDAVLIVLFKDDFKVETLDKARAMTTVVSWGCDDHAVFKTGYMQRYAPHLDYCITTYAPATPWYEAAGQPNVIVSQWGCNHNLYRPSIRDYLYEVTFVGLNYGPRLEWIEHLREQGIAVDVFGRGWPRRLRPAEPLADERSSCVSKVADWIDPTDMVEVFGRSKINLCLNNSIAGIENIKGRNFEVPACRGFLLSGPAEGLENYFAIGQEVVVYEGLDDLTEKIRFYLANDEAREEIASAGYERAMRDHTYAKRFDAIFDEIMMESKRLSSNALHA